jgi:hypothetical protein
MGVLTNLEKNVKSLDTNVKQLNEIIKYLEALNWNDAKLPSPYGTVMITAIATLKTLKKNME